LVFGVMFALAVALAGWTVVREWRHARSILESEGLAATTAIQDAVDEAFERSEAVVGLFIASYGVREDEFATFVGHIGYSPGMFGMGFIARVLDVDRTAFESRLAVRHRYRFIFELSGIEMVPRAEAAVYYPIQFFESPEQLPAWGFDAASDAGFLQTLRTAVTSRAPAASALTAFPGRGGSDGLVIFSPVISETGMVRGMVAAALDLSDLVAVVLPGSEGRLSPVVVDASDHELLDNSDWVGEVTTGDRTWLVGVDKAASSALLSGAAVFGAGLAAAVASMLAAAATRDRILQRGEVERLQELDRQKNEFLAAVSHELRTPLTTVLGFADELAGHSGLGEDDRAAMARTISDEARAMEGIVADLLVAARLQDNQSIGVHLERVIDPAAEARSIGAPGVVTVVDGDPGRTAISVDRGRFRQIVRNLLDNAIRHGEPPVHVEVRRRAGMVELVVRDHGPGVAYGLGPFIFDKYLTSARPDGRAPTTGIGLWVSRELARLMGGDLVLAESAHGAEFVLSLPAADPAQAVGF
jgi:signal transduction histidine kinase